MDHQLVEWLVKNANRLEIYQVRLSDSIALPLLVNNEGLHVTLSGIGATHIFHPYLSLQECEQVSTHQALESGQIASSFHARTLIAP